MKELRKLKYRFVVIVMALLLIVTTSVFTAIYYSMYRTESQQSMRMLEDLAARDGSAPKRSRPQTDWTPDGPPADGLPADAAPDGQTENNVFRHLDELTDSNPALFAMFRNSFSIRLDADGNILSLNSAGGFFQGSGTSGGIMGGAEALPEEDLTSLQNAIQTVLNGEKSNGILEMNGTPYRFLIVEKPYGHIISMLDRSLEAATLNRLLSTLLLTGGIGLVLLFGVSLILAERAILPVRKAWERQKRFIADASHELKTPLTVIAANTDVVLANRNDTVAAQAKWIGYIRSETERMAKLVNDLLMIAKLDASENKPMFLPFDLSETVADACLPLESLAFESGRQLVTDLQPNVQYVGEESGIRQAVGILVDNAIKHATGEGDILVTLRREGDAGKIRIAVSNPGEGIPKEDCDRIFERFYRLDASRARDTGGYGLGLSIAKTVMDRHEGTIHVESEPGGKTVFTLVLPHRKG